MIVYQERPTDDISFLQIRQGLILMTKQMRNQRKEILNKRDRRLRLLKGYYLPYHPLVVVPEVQEMIHPALPQIY